MDFMNFPDSTKKSMREFSSGRFQ
jgi:hypothetical protein